MKTERLFSAAVRFALLGILAQASVADAAEIKVLCSTALKTVMEELVPKFEQTTKHKVVVEFGLAAVMAQRIEAGEAFDVAVLTPAPMDEVIKRGKIVPNTRAVIARSGLGIVIRAGARKRDISTVEAFKRALLDAKSIAYAKEGAAGTAFAPLIQKLGIADDLKSKIKLTANGAQVSEAVVHGDAEFGVLPVSEILPVRGAELLGTFPADLQSFVVMVAGVSASSTQGDAARQLIAFLMAPASVPVIKAKGMER
jgi:molybdate transport system substrate-binding protein